MTVQTFRDILKHRPFKPVRIAASSGETYDIRHPEMAFLDRTSIYIGTGDEDDGVPAEFRIVSLLHITAIEPLTSRGGRKRSA
jgi:hypothetical protein